MTEPTDGLAGQSVRALCYEYWQAANSPREAARMNRVVVELERRIGAAPPVPADVAKDAEVLEEMYKEPDFFYESAILRLARYVRDLAGK